MTILLTWNRLIRRYKAALATDEFKDIKSEWAHEIFEAFHQAVNNLDGANSWYETSCNDHDYENCEGDFHLNWKDKGYITVFDLLQVNVNLIAAECGFVF